MSGNIILIHGAFHTGDCWFMLKPLLEQRSFTVHAPTLRGQRGNPRHPLLVTMGGYARDIVACARELDGPSLLLGHSLAGFPISLAAEMEPALFTKLIYLAAALPKLGKRSSLLDAAPPDKKLSDMKIRLASSVPPEVARADFYNCCTRELQERALALLSPQPILPLLGRVKSTVARLGEVEKHAILCSQDRMMPIDFALANTNQHMRSVQTLDTDHSPFLSQPEALAEAIERIAATR